MECIVITGQSGSGKSVALKLLEDLGYYCVDNLPLDLLANLCETLQNDEIDKFAVSVDIRGKKINELPEYYAKLAKLVNTRLLFLMAKNEVLVKRYSESRRRHPLSTSENTLLEAIEAERLQLQEISHLGHSIDTSELAANSLRNWVAQFASLPLLPQRLSLFFQSFGFKHGLPSDADLVFDVRCLPNPHYVENLRALTGKDQAVIDFLETKPVVLEMFNDISKFIDNWLPHYQAEQKNYLSVAIGCTGGRHRSVYLCEKLSEYFWDKCNTLIRHRNIDIQNY